jgi:hypothetical protein
VPDIYRELTMEEKMINNFLILLTKATSINQLKPRFLRLSTVKILPELWPIRRKHCVEGPSPSFQMLFQKNEPRSSLLGEDKIV